MNSFDEWVHGRDWCSSEVTNEPQHKLDSDDWRIIRETLAEGVMTRKAMNQEGTTRTGVLLALLDKLG